ncbi:hypothetical protein L249_7275 [Ophiocordyceps polyrhachis-furcata BCC 54312]|uniref:Uncharacterized protein n=1 Tax=Ophiocordyceps polyrhachis-furcata BCC 54312 TaxID=1330021 RepID=A0A367LAR5_9HYPO|nr:hypothetical protein L249_7275 [Ophiocordyceps polyrhachis-furcata BCC 54312]
MAAMPTTADDDEALPSSCLSASAQTRILIWRSEVASSFHPPHLPPSSASTSSGPSSTSTLGATTTTTTTTTTITSSLLLPRPSRSRRFWRRIVRRLSLSRPGSSVPAHDAGAATVAAFAAAETAAAGGPLAGGPPTEHDGVLRTAMYRSVPPLADPSDDEQPFDVPGSESDCSILKQKQERLGRAARLLQQQQNAVGPFAI